MNELILKITNITISYPNQLSKFFAVSKVNDKIDWKLFTQAIDEYLKFHKHSTSPIIGVFEKVLFEVNVYFCKVIYIQDYYENAYAKIEELCKKENVEIGLIDDKFEYKEERSRATKFWKWFLDLVG